MRAGVVVVVITIDGASYEVDDVDLWELDLQLPTHSLPITT
jgi:hypothetical protein